MIGTKMAIIEDTPGVTRDRLYGTVNYLNYSFHLIDTGGIDISDENFNTQIKGQAQLAIDEADIILFVLDGKEGLTTNDYAVKEMLIKSGKPVIAVINKTDSKISLEHQYDFYDLGLSQYINVSAEQGVGVYDLLDEIVKNFKEGPEDYEDDVVKFSIIGRPNVGKSSLVNAILNEDRVIVSDVAGTTRDAIDTPFTYHDQKFVVIDTAGMRKRGKVYENVEKYSLLRTLKAIDRSNVCVIVINAEEGIIEHDKHIAGYALDAGKAVIIAVNKWDLIENKDKAMKEFKQNIKNEFQFMPYAPVVFLSAMTKKRVQTLMPEIVKVNENAHREIKTSKLNDIITEAYALNLPPSYKGKRLKVYFSSQVATCPPTFKIQVNSKGLIHFSYERYLENKIRENFDFEGTPIILSFKNKGEQ
jgi:GTP-binding protein